MNILSQTFMVVLPTIVLAGLCDVEPSQINLTRPTNLYQSQKNFALSMLDVIRRTTPNGNAFFSPYSAFNILLLVYFGATVEGEKELAKVLQLNWADSREMVRSAYVLEKKHLESRFRQSPLEFSSAGRIFYSNEFTLYEIPCINDRLSNEFRKINFIGKPDESRKKINAWIAKKTHNQIRDMLSAADITSRTSMVFADASYLKGQWVSKFKVERTSQKPFYTTATDVSMVPMMQQKATFLLSLDGYLDAKVLQMPFRTSNQTHGKPKSDVSMVLILPSQSLDDVLSKLNSKTLTQALNLAFPREIEVSLPKFEFEQHLDLPPIFRSMGLNKTFTPSNVFDTPVQQVAKIKVDEEGSTAAAATVMVASRSARPMESVTFECNHPFLFLVYDQTNEAILFTGIYRDPRSTKV